MEFEDYREEILNAHLYLLNYAIRHGLSYKRWQTIVTMMIKKESGNKKIHRLRVIHLYEADYNLLLSVQWRKAIHNATDKNLFNDSQ